MSSQFSLIGRSKSQHPNPEVAAKPAPVPALISPVLSSDDRLGVLSSQNPPRPVETVGDLNGHFGSLLDSEEAGRFLRIHPATVKRLARSGRLPGFRVGNRWRFRFSDLDDWAHSAVLSRHSLRRE